MKPPKRSYGYGGAIEQFFQIALSPQGIFDGDLMCKKSRDRLKDEGLIQRAGDGDWILTIKGDRKFRRILSRIAERV
jgi:hypothetical protein